MKKLLILVILASLFFFFGSTWWNQGLLPSDKNDSKPKIFIIEKGSGIREIANNLKKEELIRNPIVFFLYVRSTGIDKKIQAGDFRLTKSMPAKDIAEALTHGSLDIWVTVPEGKRAEEIAEILAQKIPTFEDSWVATLQSNEGYLFPDTYLIPKDADIKTIVTIMRGTFDKKYQEISPNTTLTQSQIVTLASLIEREAITDAEKPIIAGILMNRLNEGMALQVDATIQYAKGKNPSNNKWWEPVTQEEYKSVKSTYNTYLQPNLPPGPIANPGIEALKAAANPAETEYVYYLHDKNRTIRYARTVAEHNANIEKYGL